MAGNLMAGQVIYLNLHFNADMERTSSATSCFSCLGTLAGTLRMTCAWHRCAFPYREIDAVTEQVFKLHHERRRLRQSSMALTSSMHAFAVVAPVKLAVHIVATSISVRLAAYIPDRRRFHILFNY